MTHSPGTSIGCQPPSLAGLGSNCHVPFSDRRDAATPAIDSAIGCGAVGSSRSSQGCSLTVTSVLLRVALILHQSRPPTVNQDRRPGDDPGIRASQKGAPRADLVDRANTADRVKLLGAPPRLGRIVKAVEPG